MPTGISPISSSSSVPPSASSKQPTRRSTAPVKAPFSWPKISLSMSDSGIAAQLTATKGPPFRGLNSCSVRAASSLPVPLSPVISTEAREGASWPTSDITSCIFFERPTRRPRMPASRRRRCAISMSRLSLCRSRPLRSSTCKRFGLEGPSRTCFSSSMPPRRGMRRSETTTCGSKDGNFSSASCPSAAISVSYPQVFRSSANPCRSLASSSTTSTRMLRDCIGSP